jgi:fibronectin-binding autotransporter adhesin
MKAATVGASVPTAADNVFFDANSSGTNAYTVTCTGALTCLDITVSARTPTFATGTTPTFAISGSMSLATGTVWSTTGAITFNATTTGKTVTTATTTLSSTSVTFNGAGGAWTLGSNLTLSGNLNVTQGTFDTSSSGNYDINCAQFSTSGALARAINLNSSTINLSISSTAAFNYTGSNLTFNAGSSQINLTSTTSTGIAGNGLTFNNVSFTGIVNISITIIGANTFNNLLFTGRTGAGVTPVNFGANQTINGTLTLSAGASSSCRIFLSNSTSDAFGVQRTLTVNALAAGAADIDFRDIVIAGAAAPISGTRFGDGKGNSGITFPPAKTVYYATTTGGNIGRASPGAWSLLNNGTPDNTAFPLAQDTLIFPTAYPSAGQTITINADYNFGSVDMSQRTLTPNRNIPLAITSDPSIYGDWTNGSGTSISGTGTTTFCGRITQTITSSGISFSNIFDIQTPGGTVVLDGNLTCTRVGSTNFSLNSGNLSLQSYTLSTSSFDGSSSSAREIQFGTGQIICTGGVTTSFTCLTSTNLTTSGSQNVSITGASTVTPGNLSEANSLNFTFSTGSYTISTASSVKNLTFPASSTWVSSGTISIYGNLSLNAATTIGTAPTSLTFAASSGSKTINTGGLTIDSPVTIGPVGGSTATWTLQSTLTLGATRTLTLQSGTLNTGDFAIAINAFSSSGSLTRSIVGGTSNWTVSGASWTAGATNFSYSGTGTISMTSASPKTFSGGSNTYPTLNNGGAGALTISGSNTFANLTNTVQPTTFTFTSGTTTTFTSFSIAGTAGNLVTLGATSASQALLQKSSAWNVGLNSVDAGNNTGLSFTGTTVNYLSISYIRGIVTGPSPGNFLVFF